MRSVGFVVNPVAGMGGRVGLKGTDDMVREAWELGARPAAAERAAQALADICAVLRVQPGLGGGVRWLTWAGAMGDAILREAGPPNPPETLGGVDRGTDLEDLLAYSRSDTERACRAFAGAGAELVLFCGGDGTARDVAAALGGSGVGILGIPAGVKMHSGVFATHPRAAAEAFIEWLEGALTLSEAEILDLDEEAYRRGDWVVRLYATALTPSEPHLIQAGKEVVEGPDEEEVRSWIAEGVYRDLEGSSQLAILGPGGTVAALKSRLGLDVTLLGVDAWSGKGGGCQAGKDMDEAGLLSLLSSHSEASIYVSPIGAQGFVLGRGNHQISPEVVRRVGIDRFVVLATPAKLGTTPVLRVDSGDPDLDRAFAERGYLRVVVGEGTYRLWPVEAGPDPPSTAPS